MINDIVSADGDKQIFLGLLIQLVKKVQTAFVRHVRAVDIAVEAQYVKRLGVDQGDHPGLVTGTDMGQSDAEPLPKLVDLLILILRVSEGLLVFGDLGINGFFQGQEVFRFEKLRDNLNRHIQGTHIGDLLQARNLVGGVVAVSCVLVSTGRGTEPQLIIIPQAPLGNVGDSGYLADCQMVVLHSRGPFCLSDFTLEILCYAGPKKSRLKTFRHVKVFFGILPQALCNMHVKTAKSEDIPWELCGIFKIDHDVCRLDILKTGSGRPAAVRGQDCASGTRQSCRKE